MTHRAYSVGRIADPVEIQAIASEWNALTDGVPFQKWEWLSAWWDNMRGDNELYVVAVRDPDGRLIGAAPLMRQTTLASGRVLRLLGSGKACTDYLSVLARPELENDVVELIGAWLHNAAFGEDGWELLELDNVPVYDDRWNRLLNLLRDHGSEIHTRSALSCWWIRELDTWEGYLRRLSRSHRKQARRIMRRELAEERFEIRRADESNWLDGWDALVDLHQRRWQSRQIEGCFSNPQFTGFLFDAAHAFLADNALDLWWLEDNGSPVAAQIDFVGAGGVFTYQAGIDPDVTEYGPGQLLQTAVLKHYAETGCERYDFLRGDEGYKAHWRAEPTVCFTSRVTPKKTGAILRTRAWSAGQTLKAWIKSGLGMTAESSETSA